MKFQPNPHRTSARSQSRRASSNSKPKGFTLVEILVVLAIIAILAALLFPAFKGAQENGKQTNCASNLSQIYTAVRLYYDDEKKYPLSAAVLLGSTDSLDNSAANVTTPATTINGQKCDTNTCPNVRGTGYLKSTSILVCPDDNANPQGIPRSSYSNLATGIKGSPADPMADLGRYVWNYWGYKEDGFAYDRQSDGTTGTSQPGGGAGGPDGGQTGYFGDPGQTTSIAGDSARRYLKDPTKAYDAASNPVDVQKLPRLANRQAPSDTIITHCVFHRLPTSNLAKETDIYTTTEYAGGASDIILRLDGKAEKIDVTTWKGEKWIKQLR